MGAVYNGSWEGEAKGSTKICTCIYDYIRICKYLYIYMYIYVEDICIKIAWSLASIVHQFYRIQSQPYWFL